MKNSELNKKWDEQEKILVQQSLDLFKEDVSPEVAMNELMLLDLQIKLGKTMVHLRAIMDTL